MASKKVDINKARIGDLETLNGIGHAKAESIIEARQARGGFANIKDLLEIPGIGPCLLEQNRGILNCTKLQVKKSDRDRRGKVMCVETVVGESTASTSTPSRASTSSDTSQSSSRGGAAHQPSRSTQDNPRTNSHHAEASSRGSTENPQTSKGLRHTSRSGLSYGSDDESLSSVSKRDTDAPTRRSGPKRRSSRNQRTPSPEDNLRGPSPDRSDTDTETSDTESSVSPTRNHRKNPAPRPSKRLTSLSCSMDTGEGCSGGEGSSKSLDGEGTSQDLSTVEDRLRGTREGSCSPGSPAGDIDSVDHLSSGEAHSPEHEDDSPSGLDLDLGGSSHSSEKPWQMKRKSDGDVSTEGGKKPCRLITATCSTDYGYDSAASLRSCLAAISASNNASALRKQRIPSRSNPPPQLADWLKTFQNWSHAERLLALDEMVDLCEPTQVRHLMSVIEPQFQRDFISLLPKELALYVLSFLEPRDLLRAAQTCRYWRLLAEDNLLWREKCREESIDEASVFENRLRRRSDSSGGSAAKSPWKNLYLRQKSIEHNWRARPIRSPKVLKGHDDHVITCLEFSGTKIVSGSDDNTLKVWSAVTGKCLRTLVGHTGGVWSSQMAGNVVISGSTDRTLKVWNADTGQCTHTLYGHTSTVRCMHLNKDRVVSGSRDATLRMWDVTTGQCLHVLMGHMAAVRCVQYDGKKVVSGAYDYTVRVWDPKTESCIHILDGHTNRVYSLQFDGVHIVSGSLDTSIRVWDVESGNCLHTLIGHQSLTSGMELKDNILVSGNADSTVKVWDITTGQCLQTLQGPNKHQSAVTCLQFNKKFVITSSDDGSVKIWDLRNGDFLRNLVALDSGGSGGVVWRIRCSNTKLVCAVGSRNGTEETKLLVLDFDVDENSDNTKNTTTPELTIDRD